MKKIFTSAILLFGCIAITFAAQKKESKGIVITNWLQADAVTLHLPAFHTTKNFDEQTYQWKNLLQENQLDITSMRPAEKEVTKWNNQNISWQKISTNSKGFVNLTVADKKLVHLVSYFSTNQWAKIKINLTAFPMAELYIDGEKKISHYQFETKKPKEINEEITLEQGQHIVLIKVLTAAKNNNFQLSLNPVGNSAADLIQTSLSPKQMLTIHKVLDGKKARNTQLSSNGKLAMISYSQTLPPSDKVESWKEIQEVESGKILHTFRGSQLSNIIWLPKGNKISYTKSYGDKTSLFIFDFESGSEKKIASDITDFGYYTWAPTGKYLLYSVRKDNSKDWKIRKIQGMEDRLPGFRTRSFLYKLDVNSGVKQRLTYGALSTNLQDISSDGVHILFAQSRPDYNEYPYDKQNLYQMNVESFKVDTIWKDKLFGGYAQYSPDGTQLLVQGGADCFGKIGEDIGKQPLANNFDGQLYIFDLNTKNAKPITLHFDPSIDQAIWNKTDGNIYIKATDKDYVRLFRYNPTSKQFDALNTQSDVVRNYNLATNGSRISYTACSISTPYRAFVYDINTKQSQLISDPQKENLKEVTFGKTEDWNFTKANGKTIIGRIYYPPNFDANKKYPLIVNYYAGTLPVERSYGGRYPLNLYAAMGYVVYLLQPSGATGFGQEFSAAHQNNWGITTADEIINGTKKFIATHPFVKADKVGCIGASYGGFMTMLLQTRTDIFAAAISHAGISSISSYWGEGYWGYSYSVNASGKSFPWNNRKLYVDQSALFNADKIQTPMLLLHGSVDTNVPLGESIQLYQALKLLGKDVDFVQVKDQNHHILNYTKRILWNNTIFAYFAKYLKDQPQWWNDLYPDKNL
ncbi:S9 family peptidase [Ancylomarina longa]|uniref:S9 family peptidase n=1 Tax=Ancylomarina longa TaxID=2487017 RepID=A0A434AVR4_9BACT|nr:prolyl oligopeptidase family serine peptidase [Ancylomarina longa]RUT78549.1 S9 family peptidase [Ancylomarina longa]